MFAWDDDFEEQEEEYIADHLFVRAQETEAEATSGTLLELESSEIGGSGAEDEESEEDTETIESIDGTWEK